MDHIGSRQDRKDPNTHTEWHELLSQYDRGSPDPHGRPAWQRINHSLNDGGAPTEMSQYQPNHMESGHDGAFNAPAAPVYTETHRVDNDVESSASHRSPKEWVSRWLSPYVLGLLAAFTIIAMGALIGLCVVSSRNHGIASVNLNYDYASSLLPGFSGFGLGLLWTFLPVLTFEIYALLIGAIVKAASVRQPYIELRTPGQNDNWGAPAAKSVLLDYQSFWAPIAPWKAFRYNHYMLAFGFSVTLLLNLILTSLAAHLFYTTVVAISKPASLQRGSTFDAGLFGADSSLTPIMGIVSSTLVYGGKALPWTTLNETFTPFSLPTPKGNAMVNITVPTLAWSAGVDCKILDSSEFELLLARDNNWYFSISDRGCSLTDVLYSSPLQPLNVRYVQTYATVDCSLDSYYSRVVVVAALNSNRSSDVLTNKTAISCIPSYYSASGQLSIAIEPSTPDYPVITSFDAAQRVKTDPIPEFWANFETQLQQPRVFDASESLIANEYGQLVLEYAQSKSSNAYLDGNILKNAMEETFVAAFAVMAKQYLIRPTVSSTITGMIYTDQTRLIVVLPVAYTMLGILAAALFMLGWIAYHAQHHESILYEEPQALVGAAVILRRSKLMKRVEAIDANVWEGKVSEAFRREEMEKEPEEGWLFEQWDRPQAGHIKSTARARPFGLLQR